MRHPGAVAECLTGSLKDGHAERRSRPATACVRPSPAWSLIHPPEQAFSLQAELPLPRQQRTSSGDSWILHSWYLTNLEPRTYREGGGGRAGQDVRSVNQVSEGQMRCPGAPALAALAPPALASAALMVAASAPA